jgi:hypothetical protein
MAYCKMRIEVTVQGPLITQSTAPGAYGFDSPMARDPDGRDYLPGSHLTGKLLEAWRQLADAVPKLTGPPSPAKIKEWLGKQTGSEDAPAGDVEPARKRLVLTDLYPTNGDRRCPGRRFRISVDPLRGAVNEKDLQVIEAPYAVGESLTFAGEAHFLAKDDTEPKALRRALEIGLNWIGQIGAERTVGFGRLLNATVARPIKVHATPTKLNVTGLAGLDLVLRPAAPFCLARRSSTANLFESQDSIPGAAIKGLIAQHWTALLGRCDARVDEDLDPARPALGAWFHALRFTHALPAALPGIRPAVWPDSLAKVGRVAEPVDLALCEAPALLRDETGTWRAPAFRVDWKDESDIAASFGWPRLTRELRVRTAISEETRRAADDQLFAYEMIWPWHPASADDGPSTPIDWYARLDLSRIPAEADRQAVVDQLASLIGGGLLGLGKTKAPVGIELTLPGLFRDACPSSFAPIDSLWLVTLQTPALLCDPESLDETSGCDELAASYSLIWKELSGSSLRLVRYFARQTLAGGGYLHRRFRGHGKPYRPYLLTEPGAVFVLVAISGRESEAEAAIKRWGSTGLPLPEWAKKRYGDDWSTCPYLPQNGYGEVAANLGCHQTLRPRALMQVDWEE